MDSSPKAFRELQFFPWKNFHCKESQSINQSIEALCGQMFVGGLKLWNHFKFDAVVRQRKFYFLNHNLGSCFSSFILGIFWIPCYGPFLSKFQLLTSAIKDRRGSASFHLQRFTEGKVGGAREFLPLIPPSCLLLPGRLFLGIKAFSQIFFCISVFFFGESITMVSKIGIPWWNFCCVYRCFLLRLIRNSTRWSS